MLSMFCWGKKQRCIYMALPVHVVIQKIHRDTLPTPEDVQAQPGKLDKRRHPLGLPCVGVIDEAGLKEGFIE